MAGSNLEVLILIFLTGQHVREGTYVLSYEGEGTITYNSGVKDEAASSAGRDVLNISNSQPDLRLTVTSTNPNNNIRNIRLVPEQYENQVNQAYANDDLGKLFNPDFVDKIRDFEVLRFMDWMGTNNSTKSQWSDRQHPDMYTFTPQEDLFDGGGMPVEYMVALGNETNTDVWFTMPHLATDDYITRFAEYVRDNLDPNLNVYVEYSNEVWNGQFDQAQYARQQGQQLTHYDADEYAKGFDWYSKRTTEVTQILG